ALHVGAARLDRLAACRRAEDVEEGVPAHHVLFLEALEDRQVGECQAHLRAVRLQVECQIRFRIRRVRLIGAEDIPGVSQATLRLPLRHDAADVPLHEADRAALAWLDPPVSAEPGAELAAVRQVLPDALRRPRQVTDKTYGENA